MRSFQFNHFCLVFFLCHAHEVFAQKADKPLDVIVQTVIKRELKNEIEALGNLHSNESIVLTAKTTKTVTRLNFEDGQRVKKGAVLVEMANAEESALLNEAGHNAEEAKKQFQRLNSLVKTGAVSEALLDQSRRDYESTGARFSAIESRLKELYVSAPFSGVIGIRKVSVGSLITPGQPIATLNDDSKMKLDFMVPAVYLKNLHSGLPIEASSFDLNGSVFKGNISSIDNQIDEATRSIKVRVILENTNHELKQGMLMNVLLNTDIRKALVVNEAALVPMGSNNFVFVAQKNTAEKKETWVADRRQIKVGQRLQGVVEVLAGLTEGDQVVTHGLQKIHAGQVLSIVSADANDPNKKPEHLSDVLQQKKN